MLPPALAITPAIDRLIDLALDEDLGRGDVTTDATIPAAANASALVVAREPLVVAGLPVAERVFARVSGGTVEFTRAMDDGAAAVRGDVVARVAGPAAAILRAERTALNFLQRLSGVATLTRAFVTAAGGSGMRITDTRKTTPGYRALEKHAVRVGGGHNHRFDLGSGVLIKDNHLVVGGGIRAAVERARHVAPHGMKVEVEVDTLAQLDEALDVGAEIILLDNFATADIAEAVRRAGGRKPRPLLEVSGGVTLARIPELAGTGVDLVSVGALTHSARAVDIALDFEFT